MYNTYMTPNGITAKAFATRAIEVKDNLDKAFKALGDAESALQWADSKVFSEEIKYIDVKRRQLWDMILLLADMGVNQLDPEK